MLSGEILQAPTGQEGMAMAAGSAVDVVRACFEQSPPTGVRVGAPQVAGRLTLFPLFREAAGVDYVTFADAQKAGAVEITERGGPGTVSRLTLTNKGTLPILIIDGDLLLGLKQDRVLNTTILAPANSTIDIPVSCVEAGRWHRMSDTARKGSFSVSPGVRAAKLKGLLVQARGMGEFDSDQAAVWDAVDKYARSLRVTSRTRAYSDIEEQRRPQIEKRLAQLKQADGQAGVLAAVGGRPVSFDLFDRAETLTKCWQGLVGSYVTESLAASKTEAPIDVESAAAWIRALARGEASVHPSAGLGETALISAEGHALSALVVEGVPLHIAATTHELAAGSPTTIS